MTMLRHPPPPKVSRLASLDVFRGIAIAGMLIVNNPGSRRHMYPFLRHAGWDGCNLADLVFPFFLFIVGASAAFSLPSCSSGLRSMPQPVFWRIIRRTILLFSLGVLLNAFPKIALWIVYAVPPDFGDLRITGVLQRISIVYCFLAVAVFYLPIRILASASALLLLGYWAALILVPVPGFEPGNMTPDGNLAVYIDRLMLPPNHLYAAAPVDPEGFFATLPACVTAVAGYCAGTYLRAVGHTGIASVRLALAGIALLAGGYLWGFILPVCKDLWTGSFVFISAGWSLVCLALCHRLIDAGGLQALGLPFRVLGRNALFVFIASGCAARILLTVRTAAYPEGDSLWSAMYSLVFPPLLKSAPAASLAFSLAYLLFWWLILYGMYRRRLFLKI